MPDESGKPKGRGAFVNPDQRFSELNVEHDPGETPIQIKTRFYRDFSQSIITRNDSPDLSFEASLNPYRGCEHGCAYCYARPSHEWLGWSAGTDFESRIMVKQDAALLLRQALCKKGYHPTKLACSGITDPYQPCEKQFQITRQCLTVLAEARHPVVMITKNHLITRDIDHLAELARHGAAAVYISITSLNAKLAHQLEPRASSPSQRLDAIRQLRAAGIPVGVSMAPVIPALTDEEIPAILQAAAAAGAQYLGSTVVRLPFAVKDVFAAWLDEYFPDRKAKILGRIQDMQGPTLSSGDFGTRLKGQGVWAEQVRALIQVGSLKSGLKASRPEVSAASFRRPADPSGQLELALGE
jgi:DNA repair photolyase